MTNPLLIKPTNYSPCITLDPSGVLSIKGRSLMLDAISFYQPVIDWLFQLDAHSVQLTIELDYFNTASSKKLIELLKVIDTHNNVKEFIVYWGFESDDDDTLLKGQILEEKMKNARFYYKELAGV
jgi:hypothetical protein